MLVNHRPSVPSRLEESDSVFLRTLDGPYDEDSFFFFLIFKTRRANCFSFGSRCSGQELDLNLGFPFISCINSHVKILTRIGRQTHVCVCVCFKTAACIFLYRVCVCMFVQHVRPNETTRIVQNPTPRALLLLSYSLRCSLSLPPAVSQGAYTSESVLSRFPMIQRSITEDGCSLKKKRWMMDTGLATSFIILNII